MACVESDNVTASKVRISPGRCACDPMVSVRVRDLSFGHRLVLALCGISQTHEVVTVDQGHHERQSIALTYPKSLRHDTQWSLVMNRLTSASSSETNCSLLAFFFSSSCASNRNWHAIQVGKDGWYEVQVGNRRPAL